MFKIQALLIPVLALAACGGENGLPSSQPIAYGVGTEKPFLTPRPCDPDVRGTCAPQVATCSLRTLECVTRFCAEDSDCDDRTVCNLALGICHQDPDYDWLGDGVGQL
jgi:hypothetical protein